MRIDLKERNKKEFNKNETTNHPNKIKKKTKT